jgi:hypothetical protein
MEYIGHPVKRGKKKFSNRVVYGYQKAQNFT